MKEISNEAVEEILKQYVGKSPLDQNDVIDALSKKYKITKKSLHDTLKVLTPDKPKEEKEKEDKPIETSMINHDDKLFEEVCGEDGVCQFVTIEDGKPIYHDTITTEDGVHIPIDDDAVKTKAILLPQQVTPYDNIEDLIEEIKAHIHKYLDVTPDYEVFATYYILLSWVYDKLYTIPYLRALGDTGTGKSRFLDVIGGLCYKTCVVSGCITPAPIYRIIKRWGGTLVIDEADFRDSSEKNEVITILNCGFERNKPVIRCEKDNPDNVQFLPTYCPKVISTRQTFYDKALESRCLTEQTKQTQRKEIIDTLDEEFEKEQCKIRNKLLYFRFMTRHTIDVSIMKDIELGNIEPRLKQATKPFAILFANIPELMTKFKTFLQKYQQDLIEERSTTYEGLIVGALYDILLENGCVSVSSASSASSVYGVSRHDFNISSKDIVNKLKEDGVEITPQKVGKRLKSLGLRTSFLRSEKKRVIDLKSAENLLGVLFARYIPVGHDTNDALDANDTKCPKCGKNETEERGDMLYCFDCDDNFPKGDS